MKKVKKQDPLLLYALTFVGEGGIYRWADALGFVPNHQQREAMDAYNEAMMGRGNSRIACRAGKGPGKTKVTAVIFNHWSVTHANSALIVTAPTFRQCQGVWLSEAKATIYGSTADERIGQLFKFVGKGYGVLGAKPSEWGCQLITALSKEAFQGLHRLYIAFLEEEASGVKSDISGAIKETISNSKGTWFHMRIGNPNTRLCAFFDSFHSEGSKWKQLHWNTEETEETIYFSRDRNKDIEEEFGKDSDIYRISVLGEFPNLDPNCLISEEDLVACCTDDARYNAIYVNPDRKKQIGTDLARYGGDENVVVPRDGGMLLDMWARKTDPNNAIDRAIAFQDVYGWENNKCVHVVDTSGMGEVAVGAMGDARRMGRSVHEFYSQNTAYDSEKYENKISEAWCMFAKLTKKRWVYLGSKLDKKLKDQLTTRRYVVTPKGKIKIESKDEYAKNNEDSENGTIGKSPDRADAVIMAFYDHAVESSRIACGG
ncbi:hypothetical protein KAR91_71020 [Candidatus Pacearchaeota archaeon]|nr:hypothetical protein [Candidatus Pacearchaeota archaeon]